MVRLLVVLGALASLAVARPALACSRAADSTALRTIPAQGAEGVPTDVAILVNVETMHLESQDTLPSGFCTLRTQDGEIVPTTTERIAWWHGEVRPIAPLTPHSTYALEVQIPRWDGSTVARTMTFTTGGGPLDVALEPPVAKLYSWQLARHVQETSCEFPIGTCLAIPPGEVVQVLFIATRDSHEGSGYLLAESPYALGLSSLGFSQCLRLRRRAMNGAYSEPVVLCAADEPIVDLMVSPDVVCTSDGIVYDKPLTDAGVPLTDAGAPIALDAAVAGSVALASTHDASRAPHESGAEGGCAMARSASAGRGMPLAMLLGMSMLALRRQRPQRRRDRLG